MSRRRRKRILDLIGRVDRSLARIKGRHEVTRELFASGDLVVRELILIARRGRLLKAHIDDARDEFSSRSPRR